MKNKRTLALVLIALFAAIISVLTIIPIPINFLGVPMTLQTFAIAFCGFMLGWKLGLASVGIYILLGGIGVPVFSGMQGGFGRLAGPTGGFIYGFLLMVLLCGLSEYFRRPVLRWVFGILLGTVGLLLCHLCGVFQLSLHREITFWQAATGASIPFLPKDIASVVLAFALAFVIRKRLHWEERFLSDMK